MSDNKALTLEELRQMDGKPVLFVSLKDGRRKWRVVQSIEKLVEVVKVICFTDDGGETVESYGKTWLAYAAELPSLDRSAWEPCGACKNGKDEIEIEIPAFEALAICNQHMNHGPLRVLFRYPFCPYCGRPLTDAAWEMLEKRLEGARK